MVIEKKPIPALSLEMFVGENDTLYTKPKTAQELAGVCLINTNEKLEAPPVAMQIDTEMGLITLFTKGNFSIITGAAKSRKSFLISLLVAAALKGRVQDLLVCKGSGVNILFDTEQSRYKAHQVAIRILDLADNDNTENLRAYSLRTLEPSQRLDLIDYVLSTTPNINFVAIDGIIDLEIDPILQAEQAQRIVMKLMQWTEIYNIHIVCVLHYNKTVATLLGHLGSFSHRKADAIIEVSKSKDDENISIVRPVDCREKEFPPFAFSVDEHGMPEILKDHLIEAKTDVEGKVKKRAFSFSQVNSENHGDILKCVFSLDKKQSYDTCWRNIKNAVEKVMGELIGDNKAKDFLSVYMSDGYIIKKVELKKKAVYTLPS